MYLFPEADGGMRASARRQGYGLFRWGMCSWLWARLTLCGFRKPLVEIFEFLEVKYILVGGMDTSTLSYKQVRRLRRTETEFHQS